MVDRIVTERVKEDNVGCVVSSKGPRLGITSDSKGEAAWVRVVDAGVIQVNTRCRSGGWAEQRRSNCPGRGAGRALAPKWRAPTICTYL